MKRASSATAILLVLSCACSPAGVEQPQEPHLLRLLPDGNATLDGDEYTDLQSLQAKLQDLAGAVIFVPEPDLPFDEVRAALDMLRAAGVKSVELGDVDSVGAG